MRYTQPQSGARILPQYSAAKYNLMLPSAGLIGWSPAPSSTAPVVTSGGLSFGGSPANLYGISTESKVSGYPFTCVLKFVARDTSTNTILLTVGSIAGSGHRLQLDVSAGSFRSIAVGSTNIVDSVPIATGVLYTVVYVGESATNRKLYVNGTLVSSSTTSVTFSDAFTKIGVDVGFNQVYTTGVSHSDSDISLAYVTQSVLPNAASISANPWQIFADDKKPIFIGVGAAPSGLSITVDLATASASGHAATVNLQSAIHATLATATASGFTANVGTGNAITATLATASAVGHTATVNRQLNITATQAAASASGNTANVQLGNDISISATQAITTASGFDAAINLRLTVAATLATATASGFDASISNGASIAASYGLASADGYQAQVNLQRDLAVTQALATAFGALATIRFGGAGTYPTAEEIVAALLAHPQFLTLTKFLALKDI